MENKYYIKNLTCANCAAKIEEKLKSDPKIEKVVLNFMNETLEITTKKDETKYVQEIINNIESGVIISQDEIEEKKSKKIYFKLLGVVIFIWAIVSNTMLLYVLAYLLIGFDVLYTSLKNIKKKEIFDENFLMSIATIGAFAIREFPEAVAVMLFYEIGEFFQDKAVEKSRKSIRKLMDIKPEYAVIKESNILIKVNPKTIEINDIIIVSPGEKIPLDGIIINGSSFVDTKALTGESVPQNLNINDEVLSGSINQTGVLEIKVMKNYENSTVSKIMDLVENATSHKAENEKFITKFAKIYTPIVVSIAIFVAFIPPLFVGDFNSWIYKALIFLVVSCPCALVLSIPVTYFGGIGAASKNGILIKGSNHLETLTKINTIIFDKTGTLTKGTFKVSEISPVNLEKNDLLKYAAIAESYSNHPIAKSILQEYSDLIDLSKISNYEEIHGYGIKVNYENNIILVGNKALMDLNNIEIKENSSKTIIHIAINNIYEGFITISDEIKENAKETINYFKQNGIKTIMLTGDTFEVGQEVGNFLNLDEIHTNLLPIDKVNILNKIKKNGKVIFVGDGINDAPVLISADIGIAMGGVGSDAAIEASDIVIMNDDLSKIKEALKISKKTRAIVIQNIILAFIVKILVMTLATADVASLWEAVFADVGVALLAVLNALRILKIKSIDF